MSNSLYRKFTENNEWEGEEWNFYLPVAGNEGALAALSDQVARSAECADRICMDMPYTLSQQEYTEEQVDTLVELGSAVGYLPSHNKLSGRLTLPDLPEHVRSKDFEAWNEAFYKGGIRKLCDEKGVPSLSKEPALDPLSKLPPRDLEH